MGSNTIGKRFSVTSFGESHGKHIGVVIDGFPANVKIDEDFIQAALDRRRPGQSALTTQRNESDRMEITTGVFEGKSTGAPITILIPNKDQRPEDYDHLKEVYRPSHADYTYEKKYGHRDHTGGGRSSARVTAGWVAAGALAETYLIDQYNIELSAWVSQVYDVQFTERKPFGRTEIDASIVRCPNAEASDKMEAAIQMAKEEGDSLGGIVSCYIRNFPVGIGNPVFEKLNAQLAHAMFSINAVKGFQLGSGFDSVKYKGSELNDSWEDQSGETSTSTNNSGGIQGGISNGQDIYFDVAFKPTATIGKSQQTINKEGENIDFAASGRHDPCVVPRAVTIVEAMAAIVLLDQILA